jgi:hypothetical protein
LAIYLDDVQERRLSEASVGSKYLGRKHDNIPTMDRIRRSNDFFSKKR